MVVARFESAFKTYGFEHMIFENVVKPIVLATLLMPKHKNTHKTNEKTTFWLPNGSSKAAWLPGGEHIRS